MTAIDRGCLETLRHERAVEDHAVSVVRAQVVARLTPLTRRRLPSKVRAAQVEELRWVLSVLDGPHGDVMEADGE